MSTLRTLGGYAKAIVVWFFRVQMLVLAGWGVFGLLTGQWLMAVAGFTLPALYFGRFVWRGYRDAPTQPEKKVAD